MHYREREYLGLPHIGFASPQEAHIPRCESLVHTSWFDTMTLKLVKAILWSTSLIPVEDTKNIVPIELSDKIAYMEFQ